MFSEMSSIRKEFSVRLLRKEISVTLQTHTNTRQPFFDIDSLISFLSLAIGFPMHALIDFYLKIKIMMRNVQNRGFKQVRDFIEVSARMGDTGEGRKARWRTKTLMRQTPLFHELEPCVCVTRMKMCKCDCARAMCRKLCVQQVSVCTPAVVHAVVTTTCVRNPENLHSSLHDHLDKKKLQFFVWVRNALKILIPCLS